QLRARARRLKKMHHIDILFVDYLQLLHRRPRNPPDRSKLFQ
ncbi:MAG: hypothetical protein EBT30_06515, partial [Verrucomicrobia bacterium]|nr:hypothetical protein [Verrucomicrobiota bacterium]